MHFAWGIGLLCEILENWLTSWRVVQDVDEKLLYDTFSAFGVIVTNPKVRFPFCLLEVGVFQCRHSWML